MDERKAAILRAVIERYIETAQPVGSSNIARGASLGVSPATVRNEMLALEREGYLHQPHVSAGRVPTDKGYRYYVDALEPPRTPQAVNQRVRTFFDRAHGELERMLADTSRLLGQLTNYAGVVVGPQHETATVRSAQLVGLSSKAALLVVVLSNGAVEKHVIDLPTGTDDARVGAASAHLSAHLDGASLARLPTVPKSGDGALDKLVAVSLRALAGADEPTDDHVFMGGAARMASAFDAVDTVRQVLATLEQQFVVVSLLREVLARGETVSIGTEHGIEPLAECSVVVAPYEVEGEAAGTIAVLGPTRMDYSHALAAVAVVSRRLGERLSTG